MEKERHKYSDLNKWKYEILYTLEGDEYVIREKLDFLEVYYIIKYDSIFSGLNTVLGNYTKIAYNRFFIEYYIKSDKKEKHKIPFLDLQGTNLLHYPYLPGSVLSVHKTKKERPLRSLFFLPVCVPG